MMVLGMRVICLLTNVFYNNNIYMTRCFFDCSCQKTSKKIIVLLEITPAEAPGDAEEEPAQEEPEGGDVS